MTEEEFDKLEVDNKFMCGDVTYKVIELERYMKEPYKYDVHAITVIDMYNTLNVGRVKKSDDIVKRFFLL